MNSVIINQVIEQLKAMPQQLQWQVLEFTQNLRSSQVRGVPGQQLLQFAGSISTDDLVMMQAAIHQDCEQVDLDGW
ncbi:MAG: hypothetical protein VKJ46_02970 [Leptolyngbyaceae bacterium]|nr:hypothetical protein [Leptolyngbyaceae bacterium]